jgi:hypothetical protein
MHTGELNPKSRGLYPKEALLVDHGDDPTVHEQRRARIMVTEHDPAIFPSIFTTELGGALGPFNSQQTNRAPAEFALCKKFPILVRLTLFAQLPRKWLPRVYLGKTIR